MKKLLLINLFLFCLYSCSKYNIKTGCIDEGDKKIKHKILSQIDSVLNIETAKCGKLKKLVSECFSDSMLEISTSRKKCGDYSYYLDFDKKNFNVIKVTKVPIIY